MDEGDAAAGGAGGGAAAEAEVTISYRLNKQSIYVVLIYNLRFVT